MACYSSILRFFLMMTGAVVAGSAHSSVPSDQSSSVFLGTEQFALEDASSVRMDLNLRWQTEIPRAASLPSRELRLFSFFENGVKGDKSFDLDRLVLRVHREQRNHFWFGRTQPLVESQWQQEVFAYSAIGSTWVQNQSNPLEPRVSGWIGAGWTGDVGGAKLSAMMSPIFFPSFGPRLDLSEVNGATGSRFARLPPRFLNSERELVDIRYKVATGDLGKIVLQHQAFLALEKSTSLGAFRLLGWSAPNPDPQVDIDDMIRVNSESASALVTATPKFPRETFVGFQWKLDNSEGQPLLLVENAYELNTQQLAMSGEIRAGEWLSFGGLHTFDLSTAAAPSPVVVESAPYARWLLWVEASKRGVFGRMHPSLRLERHFQSNNSDLWLNPRVSVDAGKKFQLFASVNLLAGQKYSYLSEWRSLDSVFTGVRYVW